MLLVVGMIPKNGFATELLVEYDKRTPMRFEVRAQDLVAPQVDPPVLLHRVVEQVEARVEFERRTRKRVMKLPLKERGKDRAHRAVGD